MRQCRAASARAVQFDGIMRPLLIGANLVSNTVRIPTLLPRSTHNIESRSYLFSAIDYVVSFDATKKRKEKKEKEERERQVSRHQNFAPAPKLRRQ
jgi:hypothetical protein